MTRIRLKELIKQVGPRVGAVSQLPVYSVTKYSGFVLSREYFKKQVFSRELYSYRVVEPGDFAYSTIHLDEGAIGISPQLGLISPMYTVFRPDSERVDSSYLLRFLKSPLALARYSQLGRGAVHRRKAVSLDAIGTLDVPLPPMAEQRRIAAILDVADIIRTKRRHVITHLDTLSESIFHDMFEDFRASATVREVAESIRTGPFGSHLLHSEFVDVGVAVLGLDNVVSNEFRWAERRYITTKKYEELKRYSVTPGDVLISIMGTTGRCVVVPNDIPTAINTKHICAITPRAEVLPEFLRASFLWHRDSREHLLRQAKGSIMTGLNMQIIKSMPVAVPPINQQRKFVAKLDTIKTFRMAVERALALDDELFAALQHRAFRGEL